MRRFSGGAFGEERRSARWSVYGLRCRFGAWLLREHLAALCEHYDDAREAHRMKGAHGMAERCDYISIGLQYAAGISTPWRRFDDERGRMFREAREALEHASDPL